MQKFNLIAALLLPLLGLIEAQTSCPAPVTVTVTVGSPISAATSSATSTSIPITCTTPSTLPNYNLEWACQNAAADGAGYLAYYTSSMLDPVACAAYCDQNAACGFFNVYTETQSDNTQNNICVLWAQDKPLSTATNSYNLGKPITNSAGYVAKAVQVISSNTASSAATTTTVLSIPAVIDTPIAGYTLEWSQQTAAANCAGYLTSNVASLWNPQDCADQCDGNAQCAFFNVYQQQVGSTFNYVCVLWGQDQPFATCGTNTYNNGYLISSSGGYLKNIVTIITTSNVASTSTSTSTSSLLRSTSGVITSNSVLAKTTSQTSSSAITSSTAVTLLQTTTTNLKSSSTSTTLRSSTSNAITTLATSTKASTPTTSASICANGVAVPTQCSGQNQFVVAAVGNSGSTIQYLAFDGTTSSTPQTYLTTRDKATVYYWEPTLGRFRTCPCIGIPFYRYPVDDPVTTHNFIFTLSNGISYGSVVGVVDGLTRLPIWFKSFDSVGNVGVSSDFLGSSNGQNNVLALTIVPVNV